MFEDGDGKMTFNSEAGVDEKTRLCAAGIFLCTCIRTKIWIGRMLQAKPLRFKLIVRNKAEVWKNHQEKKWFEREKGRGKKNSWSEATSWQSCDRKHERNSQLRFNADFESESAETMLELANLWEGERREAAAKVLNARWRVRETEERGSVKPGPAAIFSSGGECPAHLPSLKGTLLTLTLLLSICLVPVLSSFPPYTSPLSEKKTAMLVAADCWQRTRVHSRHQRLHGGSPLTRRRRRRVPGRAHQFCCTSGSQRSFRGVTTALRCCMADWTQRGTSGAHFDSR